MTTLQDWVHATGVIQAKFDKGRGEFRRFLETHVCEDSLTHIYEDNDTLKGFNLKCRIPGMDEAIRVTRELQPLPRMMMVCVDDADDPIEFPYGSTMLADEVTRWVSEKVGCRLI